MEFNSFGKLIVANGTAMLVAPNVILTCAHNVYSKNIFSEASRVVFFLGLNGDKALSRGIEVKKPYIYPSNYKTKLIDTNLEHDNDWAFLVL